MGRIGNFFKKVAGGIRKVFHKVIQVAPKVIDTGRKVVDVIKPQLNLVPNDGVTDRLRKAVNFTDSALNKADQLVKAHQAGGVKGMIGAGANMIRNG